MRKFAVLLLLVLTAVVGVAGTALAEHGSIVPFSSKNTQ
jgi:hypothetical protein